MGTNANTTTTTTKAKAGKAGAKALTTGKKLAKGKAAAKVATKGKGKASKVAKVAKPRKAGEPNGAGRYSGQGMGAVLGISRVPADGSIKVLAKDAPYREGTKAHATWGLIVKHKSVEGVRDAAAKSPDKFDVGYLRYAARDGFISFGK